MRTGRTSPLPVEFASFVYVPQNARCKKCKCGVSIGVRSPWTFAEIFNVPKGVYE